MVKNIILFASGNGTNAENIVKYFQGSSGVKVAALFCNNPKAGVIERMNRLNVPVHLFDKKSFHDENTFLPLVEKYNPQLIVLAGFLWLIPIWLIKHFPHKIINIHPALLPKYGGKGMFGHHVHEAVVASGEKEHGITVHEVNQHYDEGPPLFQAKFEITKDDNVESVSKKIAQLEMTWFPEIISKILSGSLAK